MDLNLCAKADSSKLLLLSCELLRPSVGGFVCQSSLRHSAAYAGSSERGCGSLSFIISRRVWRLSGKNSGFGQWMITTYTSQIHSATSDRRNPIFFPLFAFY
jgi:hypothetical protein